MTDTPPTPQPDDDGGPAFPDPCGAHPGAHPPHEAKGMSLRQYAAIKLRVPRSGDDWLDDMIRESLRDQFAGQALAGWMASFDTECDYPTDEGKKNLASNFYDLGSAMLAEKQRCASEGGEPS